jgi:hypothetical protein
MCLAQLLNILFSKVNNYLKFVDLRPIDVKIMTYLLTELRPS